MSMTCFDVAWAGLTGVSREGAKENDQVFDLIASPHIIFWFQLPITLLHCSLVLRLCL